LRRENEKILENFGPVPAKERAPIQGKGYSSEFLRSLCQERKM
jgi:hypothetical protein